MSPSASDDRDADPDVWIYVYDRRTRRALSHRKATDEELPELLARGGADDEPTAPPSVAAPGVFGYGGESTVTTFTYIDTHEAPPPVNFDHDPAAGVFRLTAADGSVEVYRDNPTRYLCVEPEPETGAMRPVMKRGRPVCLYLCREEREAR